MDSRNSIRAMGAHDSKIGHADSALWVFLDQADSLGTSLISGEAQSNFVEQSSIDFVNNLQLPRQEHFEPRNRPLFECLGEQGMVGIGQSLSRQVPGLIPSEM